MKAVLLLNKKQKYKQGFVELVIWKLPGKDKERRHGLKYRLVYIVGGERLVGYDNERGKGDHKHIQGREYPYEFVDIDQLIEDFLNDIREIESG